VARSSAAPGPLRAPYGAISPWLAPRVTRPKIATQRPLTPVRSPLLGGGLLQNSVHGETAQH